LSHPLEAYFYENKPDKVPDEKAKEAIRFLVNDDDMVKEVCSIYSSHKNIDNTCYSVGKLYDVDGISYGCITILSEDVVYVIGKDYLEETQKKLNYLLISTYLEYKKCFDGKDINDEVCAVWDDYVDIIMSKNFLPLYQNGIRVKLIYNTTISKADLSVLVFIIYQDFDEIL
jgi:hypothetical protein